MQEQKGRADYELKGTREDFVVSEEERNRSINELKEAKRLAFAASMMKVNEGPSPKKDGELMAEIKKLKELLSKSEEELKMKDDSIGLLKVELQRAKQFEAKLSERDASLARSKEEINRVRIAEAHASQLLNASSTRIQELEDDVQRGSVSEAKMLDSLASQTKQLEQIKMELEESRIEIASLTAKIASLEASSNQKHSEVIVPDRVEKRDLVAEESDSSKPDHELVEGHVSKDPQQDDFKSSELDEMKSLRNELKLALDAEEKSKKAMDDLALALKEVATEAHQAKEKLGVAQLELEHVKDEAEQLKKMVRSTEERYEKLLDEAKKEAELYRNTADRLRIEAEESLLAWNGKEMGFVSCIKRAEEERAICQHENSRLTESLKAAEPKVRAAREENFKLRDILKQAISEANAAKAAAGLARDENSYLKDCLAEKEEALLFLSKENERLRINEAAAHENVKEFKRLLATASTELKTPENEKDGLVRTHSLRIEHDEDTNLERQNFSFNLDELKFLQDSEDSDHTLSHEDPEKEEALKGSIFDTTDSPRSEPQTPKPVSHHTRDSSSAFTDDGETTISEDLENPDSSHCDDSDSDRNHRRRKTMFRRVGDLIMRKSYYYHKREPSSEKVLV
ncbi:OLC1v1009375C1 [Oldenlandia corymbosa var. corymbosa]|nr:OLC1v1009375C1 [Oldenlandia corymbosa var. corymbosa]